MLFATCNANCCFYPKEFTRELKKRARRCERQRTIVVESRKVLNQKGEKEVRPQFP